MKQYKKSEIKTFLESVNILSMASIGERGPISSPLLFTVDSDLNFYFATHRESFKSQAILSHPNVSLSIWKFDEMLVQVDALCNEVSDHTVQNQVLTELATATTRLNHFWPPVLRIPGDAYIIFRATPTWLRLMDMSETTIIAGDTPFQEIDL